ncbi:conserved hypothetical protein, secreted, partial [Candidatus Omnitrophus magneticus]
MKIKIFLKSILIMVFLFVIFFGIVNAALATTASYTYYAGSGRIESESYTFDYPYPSGWYTYIHYIDENWNSAGVGRIDKRVKMEIDGSLQRHEYGMEYEYYAGTNTVKFERRYYNVDYADPSNTVFSYLVNTIGYDQSGRKIYEDNGSFAHTYYGNTGNLESTRTPGDYPYGYRYAHFLDKIGYIKDFEIHDNADADGAIAYAYEYYSGTNTLKFKRCYATGDYSNLSNPSVSNLLVTYEYDTNGNLIPFEPSGENHSVFTYYADSGYMQSETRSLPDERGCIYVYFFNQSGFVRGAEIFSIIDSDSAKAYTYEYHNGTTAVKFKRCYESGNYSDPSNPVMNNLIVTYEYDVSGGLIARRPEGENVSIFTYYADSGYMQSETRSLPDERGCIYVYFFNEPDYVRSIEMFYTADSDGARVYVYEYYLGTTAIKFKRCYESADYSDPSNPVVNNLIVTYEYDAQGNILLRTIANENQSVFTYYADTGYVKSETWSVPDAWGNIYKYYLNEPDTWGTGHGRELLEVRSVSDASGVKGYKYEYDGDTYIRIKEYKYSDIDYSSSDSPILGGFITASSYFYNVSGNTIGERKYLSGADLGIALDYQNVSIAGVNGWRVTKKIDSILGERTWWMYAPAQGGALTYAVYYNKSSNTYSTQAFTGNVVIKEEFSGTTITKLYVYNFDADDPFNGEKWTNQKEIDLDKFVGFSASGTINPNTFVWYSSNLPELTPLNTLTYYSSGRIHTKYDTETKKTYEYFDDEGSRIKKEINDDGSYKIFEYGADGTLNKTKNYSIDETLIEERIRMDETQPFIGIGNLAWSNYGHDLGAGVQPDTAGQYLGYSVYPQKLYDKMKKWENNVVRIFLFCDLRAGITFSSTLTLADGTVVPYGSPVGFTSNVYEDMQTLLDTAKNLNIKLMPVLFDYRIADGINSYYEGEHPDLITDGAKRNGLVEIFRPFIKAFGNNDSIYAWDVMNEPEMACEERENIVPLSDMKEFVRDFIEMIHTEAGLAKVTVGSFDKGDMMKNWVEEEVDAIRQPDIYQFHYYDTMAEWHPIDFERLDHNAANLEELSSLNGKPVIAGELDPTYVIEKMDTLADNGYNGALFWDDADNPEWRVDPNELNELKNWFYGKVIIYYADTGFIEAESFPVPSPGNPATLTVAPSNVENLCVYVHYKNEDFNGVGIGRIDRVISAKMDWFGAKAFEYEYFAGTNKIKYVKMYHTADYIGANEYEFKNPVFTREFDINGTFVNQWKYCTYYSDTGLKKEEILSAPDEWGNVYKFYIDEIDNWNYPRSHGRELIEKRNYADSLGARAYKYVYYGDTYNRVEIWKYNDVIYSNFSSVNDPALDHLLARETYYTDENWRIQSVTFGEADSWGMVYKYYFNEPDTWGAGHGREYLEVRFEADSEGILAYKYEYDASTYNRIVTYKYAGADYSDPYNPVLINYYAGGNIKEKFLINEDSEENIYYHYIDENWANTGIGRRDTEKRAASNESGEIAFKFEYYDGSEILRYKYSYTDSAMNILYGRYEYDEYGNFINFLSREELFDSAKPSAYLALDGNDYVKIQNSESLNFRTGDFSISAWVKTSVQDNG